MPVKEFDPKTFIDRELEQELFEDLLQLRDTARILAICDTGGMGKSQLLQRLQYRCRTVKPRTPVTFLDLEDVEDGNAMTLVKMMADELTDKFNIPFQDFNRYYFAQASGDFGPIQRSVFLQGSNFTGASDVRIASVQTNVDVKGSEVNVINHGIPKLTPQQQTLADRVCIHAFFSNLAKACAGQTIVMILDTFEKCTDELKDWIIKYMLERQFFDLENRPGKLILVLAGREVPTFETNWAADEIKNVVRSVNQLGKWKKIHVEEFLRVHGFTYEPEHVETFYNLIKFGLAPSDVALTIQRVLKDNCRKY